MSEANLMCARFALRAAEAEYKRLVKAQLGTWTFDENGKFVQFGPVYDDTKEKLEQATKDLEKCVKTVRNLVYNDENN